MTKSFYIEACRRVGPDVAEFSVRELSGALAVGDRFDCSAGNGRSARFSIESIVEAGSLKRLLCSGQIDFDEQFRHFTVSTRPFPPYRDDLPNPAHIPADASEKEEFLRGWIEDWAYLHPLQRAFLLCLARGDRRHDQVAQTLGVSVSDIRSAQHGLTGIVLEDCSTHELWLS
jgi:hypothetical protein